MILEVQNDQIVSDEIDVDLSQHSLSTNDEISQDLSSEYEGKNFYIYISVLFCCIDPLTTPENLSNTRLRFSLDVKSSQRDIYKSDQFNIRKDTTNGRIARIQGVKTPKQKMLQILPRLRVIIFFTNFNFNSLFFSRFIPYIFNLILIL